MGILKHLNFKAASKTVKAAQQDVKRPKDRVAEQRGKKQQGGKK
jgi:hypothetical protein